MDRQEMLNATVTLLKNAGFKISRRCSSRPSCFCMVARKDSNLVLIKVLLDLGKITLRDAFELRTISSLLSATPLFIASNSRDRPLQDDTIYSRYDIYAVTLKTLEDVVSEGMSPLVEAGPGGYYVRLDGELIRNQRMKLELSSGKVAEQLGISKRTLYGYERGMAKASVSAAYNLEWMLGVPLVKSIDVFKPVPTDAGFFAAAKRFFIRNRFLQTVLKQLILSDFKVAATTRAPFDFIAQPPNGKTNILGGVTQPGEININLRAEEIITIGDVAEATPIFITDGKLAPNNNIPLFHCEELEKLQWPLDIYLRQTSERATR
jgi:putative transcriptional regulator